jgi:hypothetical protein
LGEAEAGGPVINVVPRIGGNTFSGSVFLDGTNGSLQGGNFDDELVAAGLRERRWWVPPESHSGVHLPWP